MDSIRTDGGWLLTARNAGGFVKLLEQNEARREDGPLLARTAHPNLCRHIIDSVVTWPPFKNSVIAESVKQQGREFLLRENAPFSFCRCLNTKIWQNHQRSGLGEPQESDGNTTSLTSYLERTGVHQPPQVFFHVLKKVDMIGQIECSGVRKVSLKFRVEG